MLVQIEPNFADACQKHHEPNGQPDHCLSPLHSSCQSVSDIPQSSQSCQATNSTSDAQQSEAKNIFKNSQKSISVQKLSTSTFTEFSKTDKNSPTMSATPTWKNQNALHEFECPNEMPQFAKIANNLKPLSTQGHLHLLPNYLLNDPFHRQFTAWSNFKDQEV